LSGFSYVKRRLSQEELNVQLQSLRMQGDTIADTFIEANSGALKLVDTLTSNEELHEIKSSNPLYPLIKDVLEEFNQSESDLIIAAQRFFEKYASEISGILGLYSLPYCYAAEEGSKILTYSKYLVENPLKRLTETGEFLFAVSSQGGFEASGKGLIQILRTRILHAHIRHLSKSKIDYETPINLEDMLGTNLSFSLITLRGLRQLGIEPSRTEIESYFHLWGVIGRMLGLKSDLLPEEMRDASVLERSIRTRQFRENESGKILTKSLVEYYRKSSFFGRIDPAQLMASFIGPEVAKMIGLPSKDLLTTSAFSALRLKNYFTDFSQRNFELEVKRFAMSNPEITVS